MQYEDVTRRIIGCAMEVHTILGPDILESVYENALAYELQRAGLSVACQQRLQVRYKKVIVGEFVADMIVEGTVLVENKVARAVVLAHEAQLLHYLTVTGIDVGLLLKDRVWSDAASGQPQTRAAITRPQPPPAPAAAPANTDPLAVGRPGR